MASFNRRISKPGKRTKEKAARFTKLAKYDVVEDLEKAAKLVLDAMRKGYKPKNLLLILEDISKQTLLN